MGNTVGRDGKPTSFVRSVVMHVIELFKKPPVRPLDLTAPAAIEKESPEELIQKARSQMGIDSVSDYNFAVVGASGVGKSSFVNGVRYIEDTGPDAAPVAEIECTSEVKRYKHSEFEHVVLWDMPGAGTPKHPSDTYFSDMKLYAFDCILILSADRFLKVDFDVARAALRYKTKCAFVRTKADLAVRSIVNREHISALEASKKLRVAVERSFAEGLTRAGLSAQRDSLPLFLVCNRGFWDDDAYALPLEEHEPVEGEGQEGEGEQFDETLKELDEHKVYSFLGESVKSRTIRSPTLKQAPSQAATKAPISTPMAFTS